MVAGTAALILWKQVGPSEAMYEIVPGFIVNCITVYTVNFFTGQKDEAILKEYDDVINTAKTEKI
ncbi:MAG: hypothetical protein JW837_01230 [Sedimentisphaerales bacterium]|nr:hypothetical protein [Sedimentisphaerales bacterium]